MSSASSSMWLGRYSSRTDDTFYAPPYIGLYAVRMSLSQYVISEAPYLCGGSKGPVYTFECCRKLINARVACFSLLSCRQETMCCLVLPVSRDVSRSCNVTYLFAYATADSSVPDLCCGPVTLRAVALRRSKYLRFVDVTLPLCGQVSPMVTAKSTANHMLRCSCVSEPLYGMTYARQALILTPLT